MRIRIIKRTVVIGLFFGLCCIGLTGSFTSIRPASASVIYWPDYQHRVKDFAIHERDGVWHVFAIYQCVSTTLYPDCDNTRRGFIHLVSTDLSHWDQAGFVVPPSGSGWNASDVWAPSIVEQNGVYYMFYTGVNNIEGYQIQRIGYATSTDLWNWTVPEDNPVLDCSTLSWAYWNVDSTEWNGGDCRDPYVMWDTVERQWVMFYSARKADDGTISPWIVNPTVVGVAASNDLVTWEDRGYLSNTIGWASESSHVFLREGTYFLIWTDSSGLQYATASNLYGPYTNHGAISGTFYSQPASEYASEYLSENGHDYLAAIYYSGINLQSINISDTTLSTINTVPFGSVQGSVWFDADGDGIQTRTEWGVPGVTLSLYADNGDGIFLPNGGDHPFAETTTADAGGYSFTKVVPGASYWVVVNASNFGDDGMLANMVPTASSSVIRLVTVGDSQLIVNDVAMAVAGAGWSVSDATLSVTLTLQSFDAAVVPMTNTDVPAWWDSAYRYRREIAVTAGSDGAPSGTVVQANVDLETLVAEQKANESHSDVRLVYQDGATTQEIDFDDVAGTFALVEPVASDVTVEVYYLYYGNPSASDRPRPDVGTASSIVSVTVSTEEPLYPVREGTIVPSADSAIGFSSLNGIAATTVLQGGSVTFAMSNDAGATWLHWNGTDWSPSDGTALQSNDAETITAHASSFPVGTGRLLWKAYIHADEDEYPILYNVVTSVGSSPEPPVLLTPDEGSAVGTLTPTVSFSTIDPDGDECGYEIQFDVSPTFSSGELHTVALMQTTDGWSGMDVQQGRFFVSGSTATYVAPSTFMNGVVYWRVRAIDPVGSGRLSDYSPTRTIVLPAALTINDLSVSDLASTAATVTWTTPNPSDSCVWYGIDDTDRESCDSQLTLMHTIRLYDLTPNTSYTYSVGTNDVYGQEAYSDYMSFATPPTPTVISHVAVSVTQYAATVSWVTNDASTSVIRYGSTTSYQNSVSNATLTTSHRMTITGLLPGRIYHFIIQSTGATLGQTADATFKTRSLTPPRSLPGPSILYLYD